MEKVVVTGGSGFIASHLADALSAKGYDVFLFDKTKSLYLREDQTMIIGDVLDKKEVGDAVRDAKFVYHFAGIADIKESSEEPWTTMNINVMGTCTVLEACVKAGIERFIFASTMYVYSRLGSFYRVSKQACEKLIEEYSCESDLGYTIIRLGSVYGPRANNFNSITNMIIQAFREGKITCSGNGEELREYVHVLDAVQECIRILDPAYRNNYVIVTGNQMLELNQLLKMIREIFDKEISIEYIPRDNKHHYQVTPYSFKPETAIKLIPQKYHDLGQGLLEIFYEMANHYKTNDVVETHAKTCGY